MLKQIRIFLFLLNIFMFLSYIGIMINNKNDDNIGINMYLKNDYNNDILDSIKKEINLKFEIIKQIDNPDRKLVNDLLRSDILLILQHYNHKQYLISNEILSGIILTIAQTETSTSDGIAFSNILFVKANNLFGIKAINNNKIYVKTFEYINGEKVVMKDYFQKFNTPFDCIIFLIDLWDKPRYKKLHTARNYKEFFFFLKETGYMTNPKWHLVWMRYYENYYAK